MKRFLMLILFVTQIGCSGFAEYTMISAGVLTGQTLSNMYEEYKKEKKDDKNNNK